MADRAVLLGSETDQLFCDKSPADLTASSKTTRKLLRVGNIRLEKARRKQIARQIDRRGLLDTERIAALALKAERGDASSLKSDRRFRKLGEVRKDNM
jgi:hypothetical protein